MLDCLRLDLRFRSSAVARRNGELILFEDYGARQPVVEASNEDVIDLVLR